MNLPQSFAHPQWSRRDAIQAGTIGLLGLGMNHLAPLAEATTQPTRARAKSVIFIFLSGGLSQHDSFDPKPDAPEEIRGEFRPIQTATPGISICEHLPKLAQRSKHWALVRSLTHSTNDHSAGHYLMLTGKNRTPPGFNPNQPRPADDPSIAAVAGALFPQRNNLPPAVVLPERLIHRTGRVIPGQFAGILGRSRDPWFLEASSFSSEAYGAYPQYAFSHQDKNLAKYGQRFQTPYLSLPQGINLSRLTGRLQLLQQFHQQQRLMDQLAATESFDRHRQAAISLLTSDRMQGIFDVTGAPPAEQERYGKNLFGWSLLMARRLVESGIRLVQVNLGNNETWDTHGNAFPHLKNQLLPPTDQAVSALLDDLQERGLLDETLIVMASEFGRTPRVFRLPSAYQLPGRDHWGAVQTVWMAGAGIRGGNVVGATDARGAYPKSDPQTPENFAATIYSALGIPSETMWRDSEDRPHHVYTGEPIAKLWS
ncbi:DUF1501 domain-containing protein [Tuwongella immobilis]|uniref:DUF1501 domain-containing protein n=1 Tax=Tuwongella immobilis TaxID=692036 RepID=A0A6C2YPZ3_9BACT|nr:DUF1501 domain-containing protein [Tuwongella immobilis]VIP03193.1 hypothetical protein : Uncharacterized protein OS=Singulisphaera acidiphila (strain ATCC BAA-1392 / DSM 18658 / VKM B-2454 / MOB10) GN=Sinac_5990 PE=4 SV=1: DUF1501 [Tuwongella immobilis]VTS03666.1 hypothetical protein : Uncharacterized protein OS=Singulisphaera acidiphila (strain ATCC BAA-1392 / DSM 18658 / VKM B-2454 / MOB10) GN=Sinac_5990 PE=4 SV=1: DUF1501 [Tuwongella immobilis]